MLMETDRVWGRLLLTTRRPFERTVFWYMGGLADWKCTGRPVLASRRRPAARPIDRAQPAGVQRPGMVGAHPRLVAAVGPPVRRDLGGAAPHAAGQAGQVGRPERGGLL